MKIRMTLALLAVGVLGFGAATLTVSSLAATGRASADCTSASVPAGFTITSYISDVSKGTCSYNVRAPDGSMGYHLQGQSGIDGFVSAHTTTQAQTTTQAPTTQSTPTTTAPTGTDTTGTGATTTTAPTATGTTATGTTATGTTATGTTATGTTPAAGGTTTSATVPPGSVVTCQRIVWDAATHQTTCVVAGTLLVSQGSALAS